MIWCRLSMCLSGRVLEVVTAKENRLLLSQYRGLLLKSNPVSLFEVGITSKVLSTWHPDIGDDISAAVVVLLVASLLL
ncbi:hypothetical protein Tco_0369802 [Tanacetum coccineum]